MQTTFNATVSVSGTALPDYRSFEVTERLGIAELDFNVQLDRIASITTADTVTISYSLGGGASYPLITNKKIEIVDPSTERTSFSGSGSLVNRYSPAKTIIFINETWLKSAYPRYYFRDGIIYQQDPGYTPVKYHGASVLRLYAPELPGKDVRDVDFECILQPAISYYTIAQYIGQKTGYTINITCPTVYVQKTFTINSSEPYFGVLARLYSMFNPMMYIEGTTIHVLNIGGSAKTIPSGTKAVALTADSFSLLNYHIIDNNDVVDHVLVTGPTSTWTYRYKSAMSTAKIRRSEVELPGEEETLVYEGNFMTDSTEAVALLQREFNRAGVTIGAEDVFEHSNANVDRNGRFVRTTKMKYDYQSNASAVIEETTETYNIGGDLVSKTYTKNKWADYKTPVGHIIIQWSRIGKVQGGVTYQNVGGYKNTIPTEFQFLPTSGKSVAFGDFIGETGQREVDIDEYRRVAYKKDEDTVTTGGSEEDVYVRKYPRDVYRHAGIGTLPATWEENEDDAALGWQHSFLLVRREKVRFDRASRYLLRKNRFIEEFFPVYSNQMYTEDIPLRKIEGGEERITKKWEFFCLGGNPDAIVQWDGNGNLPQPSPGGPGVVPGQPASYHPLVTINCPDVVDDYMARDIARGVFRKRVRNNTSATIRTLVPIPGVKIGSIFKLPACTKEYFNWNTKLWTSVTLAAKNMWVVGVKIGASFDGDMNKSFRKGEIFAEYELMENF